MTMKYRWLTLVFAIFLAQGCASVAVDRAKDLSAAGIAYSDATVAVVEVAMDAHVDNDSLAQIADFQTDVFTAVNTAWLHDAAVVRIGRDTVAERPIHLLFISGTASAAAYPRVVVVVGRGSRCTVLEDYVSLHASAGLTNADFADSAAWLASGITSMMTICEMSAMGRTIAWRSRTSPNRRSRPPVNTGEMRASKPISGMIMWNRPVVGRSRVRSRRTARLPLGAAR